MFEGVFSLQFLPELSLAAIFFALFFGTFISEDAACIAAGTLAAQGRIGFTFALTACFLGIFVGDMLLYGIGRIFGRSILQTRVVSRFVSALSIDRGSAWLEKRGAGAVFISRFFPGLRLPTYLAAGFLKTNFIKFAFYFLIAAAIWTPILVGSTAFAQQIVFPQNAIIGTIASIIILRLGWKLSSWKNRRLLAGRIKRLYRWEFWPLPVFYTPVVAYVFWLAIKHRGIGVFTSANPAIQAGGFRGESKNAIYRGLARDAKHGDYFLSHLLIRSSLAVKVRIATAEHFIEANGLNFPLVLKPDAGERGKGVRIIESLERLHDEIGHSDCDLILQEFAAGEEVSIFYYRYPDEEHGQIFSITEKRFPTVTGDGKSTIEQLILSDDRAICLAGKYLEQNSANLDRILPLGEILQIIDIGTHSRGAIFLDGGWLKTERLEKKIDEICRNFDGFYFGRFDIRTPSFDDLMRGVNFKIIELNGVTSESTNIYDPRYSLIDAYGILFRQWRIAFEIGDANRRSGISGASITELARLTVG